MKKQIQLIVFFVFIMLVVPLIPLIGESNNLQENQSNHSKVENTSSLSSNTNTSDTANSEEEITIYHHTTQQIQTLPMKEYIKGVVCAEIPAGFHEEAIKAQAVIAHTYALRIQNNLAQSPDESLKGAQISTDPDKHQAYFTPEEIKKRYGKQYDTYWQKVSNCVDAVINQVVTYQDQPIIAAFHSISNGSTENPEYVWGQSVPYLIPIASEGDASSPHYKSTEYFSEKQVRSILQQQYPNISFSEDKSQWFSIQSNTPGGYVDQVSVLGQQTNGQEIRKLFGLKSASFTVAYQDNQFLFTTWGYGHGVGLSQYGADYYAKQGMTYDQILAHYYPNTTLTTLTAST